MKITDITLQKHNKNRVSVFVDDEYSFSLEDTDAVKLGIKIGKEISDDDILYYNEMCNLSKARSKAMDIISRKAVTKKTLIDTLKQKGYDEEVAITISKEFEDLGYIDDFNFVISYASDAFEYKKHGKQRIENDLRKKGVSSDVIKQAFMEIDFDYTSNIIEIINAKYNKEDLIDYKTKAKIVRYLAYRGYNMGEIIKAIDMVKNED